MEIANTRTEASAPVSMDIVRSWKDPRYRRNLSPQQLQVLPEHPAGPPMLSDLELKTAGGLMLQEEDVYFPLTTAIDCTLFTFRHWKSCGC